MEEQYFTVLAAAQYLGISRDKIHYMLSNGKLEAVIDPLDGRRKLITKAQLDAIKYHGNVITPEQLTASNKFKLLNIIYLKGENEMQSSIETTNNPADEQVTSPDKVVYCSFCAKSHEDVQFVVAGSKVYICDECIALASNIVQGEKDKRTASN